MPRMLRLALLALPCALLRRDGAGGRVSGSAKATKSSARFRSSKPATKTPSYRWRAPTTSAMRSCGKRIPASTRGCPARARRSRSRAATCCRARRSAGIVVNVAELRLYYFPAESRSAARRRRAGLAASDHSSRSASAAWTGRRRSGSRRSRARSRIRAGIRRNRFATSTRLATTSCRASCRRARTIRSASMRCASACRVI